MTTYLFWSAVISDSCLLTENQTAIHYRMSSHEKRIKIVYQLLGEPHSTNPIPKSIRKFNSHRKFFE